MQMTLRVKLLAGGAHLVVSLIVAALAAMLVFGLWYPFPFGETSGGRQLFLLLILVDVVIGPLMTILVFNHTKSRRELILDLAVIGVLQLCALSYGLWSVFVARPVYLVYEYDRMRVVHAVDVDERQLPAASLDFRSLPLTGPRLIALREFENPSEKFNATFEAMSGAMLASRTELWSAYSTQKDAILNSAKPVRELMNKIPSRIDLIDGAIKKTGRPIDQLYYLPMVDRDVVWTVFIDAKSAEPLTYIPIDSF